MASFSPIRGTKAQIQATSIVDGQFLIETDQVTQNKAYLDIGTGASGERIHIGGGGHDMSPDPESTPLPTEQDVIDVMTNALTDSDNKNVTSLFGIANWTNNKTKRFALTNIPANVNTIGTWQQSEDKTQWVTTDWFFIPELKGVLTPSSNDLCENIEIRISFNPYHEEPIAVIGYQVNDDDTREIDGQTVEGGSICIKFSSHKNPCDIAVDLIYNYTLTDSKPYSTVYPSTT